MAKSKDDKTSKKTGSKAETPAKTNSKDPSELGRTQLIQRLEAAETKLKEQEQDARIVRAAATEAKNMREEIEQLNDDLVTAKERVKTLEGSIDTKEQELGELCRIHQILTLNPKAKVQKKLFGPGGDDKSAEPKETVDTTATPKLPQVDEVAKISVDKLKLSPGAAAGLKEAKLHSIGDIEAAAKEDENWSRPIKNVGASAAKKIMGKIAELRKKHIPLIVDEPKRYCINGTCHELYDGQLKKCPKCGGTQSYVVGDASHNGDRRVNGHGLYVAEVEEIEIATPKESPFAGTIGIVKELNGRWAFGTSFSVNRGTAQKKQDNFPEYGKETSQETREKAITEAGLSILSVLNSVDETQADEHIKTSKEIVNKFLKTIAGK